MYCEATRQMAAAFDLRFLDFLSRIAFIAASGSWAFVFAGMLLDLRRALTRPES
jgi:hypothetical protein